LVSSECHARLLSFDIGLSWPFIPLRLIHPPSAAEFAHRYKPILIHKDPSKTNSSYCRAHVGILFPERHGFWHQNGTGPQGDSGGFTMITTTPQAAGLANHKRTKTWLPEFFHADDTQRDRRLRHRLPEISLPLSPAPLLHQDPRTVHQGLRLLRQPSPLPQHDG